MKTEVPKAGDIKTFQSGYNQTNQIDSFLRLSIVTAIQLKNQIDEVPLKYLFQAENERGLMERKANRKSL